MKMWADLFRQGRLKLTKHFHKASATFQDSCNFIRNAGHFEDSRLLLHHVCADLREMYPTKGTNWCAGSRAAGKPSSSCAGHRASSPSTGRDAF